MDKSEGAELYQRVFKVVRRILNYVDPEGLRPGQPEGAPLSEYEMETAPIAAFALHHLKTLKADTTPLAEEINRVWRKYFDRDCPGSDAIAAQIIGEVSRS
jgi:hypothetical protein